jgi:hypothetical protein
MASPHSTPAPRAGEHPRALSRRTALAGIAGAALAAPVTAAPAAVDPVPALVAQYLDLDAQLDRASDRISAVWDVLVGEGLCEFGARVDALWWMRGPHKPHWLQSDAEIKDHFQMYHGIVPAKGGGWRTVIDPREAQTIERLREAERHWTARVEAAGVPALKAKFGAIDDELLRLEELIRETQPTTIGGVLAKLRLARHLAGPDVERFDFPQALMVKATADLERLAAGAV